MIKGQSFSVFEILIGAIFAVAVLFIINEILASYGELGAGLSIDALKDGLRGVVDSKGIETVELKDLLLSKGSGIAKVTLASEVGLDPDDLTLQCDSQLFSCCSGRTCRESSCSDADDCAAAQRVRTNAYICKPPRSNEYYVVLGEDRGDC